MPPSADSLRYTCGTAEEVYFFPPSEIGRCVMQILYMMGRDATGDFGGGKEVDIQGT